MTVNRNHNCSLKEEALDLVQFLLLLVSNYRREVGLTLEVVASLVKLVR